MNITHIHISKCNYIQQVTHNNTSFLLQIQESMSYLDSIQKREAKRRQYELTHTKAFSSQLLAVTSAHAH